MKDTHYSSKILITIKFSRQIFEKYSNSIYWEPSSIRNYRQIQTERRAGGRTDGQTDRLTVITKLIFAFRNFANAPEQTF